ncbi:uncharacterized protein DUF4440 [Luteimonas sp. J16]|jgi:hypothetical protein|uniref:nuclear transport factor 2 family protein n=1 Tax=unclassified Luteimonas TaxID=2629088 RepID=UPI0004B3A7BF|nr:MULTISPECIES: nuclear transport factor 2 family protein [unclassified Luteimonas]TWG89733.1 uncharacterized protein DUF4440 [Luteimonas sp. J16]
MGPQLLMAGRAAWALLLALAACAAPGAARADAALHATVAALDAELFDAFNRCDDPAQLARHAAAFDPAVEFYHDTGGVTWTREAMLDNTRRHACGRYTRQLVEGSLQVHPVAGFGAISQGRHRFCDAATGACDGEAEFTMVWRLHEGLWTVTRVLSYGHRATDNR